MKRYGEKAIREALNEDVIIRDWDWFTLQAGYKVTKDGETIGYITFDLFNKLLRDGTIAKTHCGRSYTDYVVVIEEKESATEEKESATEEKERATEEKETATEEKESETDGCQTKTKKVFSVAKYLSSIMKVCDEQENQDIIIPAIYPGGWVWKCDGKTEQECKKMGYVMCPQWLIEIPQNENIDFWRNYIK